MWDNEKVKIGVEPNKILTADALENAGRMLRKADLSTQSDDIKKVIQEIELAIQTFKKICGINFGPQNTEYQKQSESHANRPLGYKRLGESRAHKSLGYPHKNVPVGTHHPPESGDNTL